MCSSYTPNLSYVLAYCWDSSRNKRVETWNFNSALHVCLIILHACHLWHLERFETSCSDCYTEVAYMVFESLLHWMAESVCMAALDVTGPGSAASGGGTWCGCCFIVQNRFRLQYEMHQTMIGHPRNNRMMTYGKAITKGYLQVPIKCLLERQFIAAKCFSASSNVFQVARRLGHEGSPGKQLPEFRISPLTTSIQQ